MSGTVPISLFAAITDTATVDGVMASSSSPKSTMPCPSTGRRVTFFPARSICRTVSSTALCSVAHVTMWSPRLAYFLIIPHSAMLLASVAPDVKIISSPLAPTRRATFSLAPSIATDASCPKEWSMLDGLPNISVMYGTISSKTLLSSGVVEWLSRYAGVLILVPPARSRKSRPSPVSWRAALCSRG